MIDRVATCSVAAFLVVSTGLLYGYTGAHANANALVFITSAASAQNEAQVPVGHFAHDRTTIQSKVATLDPAGPRIKSSAQTEPFGLKAIPWFAEDVSLKWKGVEADIRSESAILARCHEDMNNCPQEAQEFLAIVAAGHARTGRARIGVINRAINLAIQKTSDLKQWGVPDRWSAPLETFKTHRGDCEDYAIAKFVALAESGVASEDVKLVIVRDLAVSDRHAVAAVHVDGGWIVLDNRWLTLVEDNEMRRMSPLFVIDHTGVRAYVRSPSRYAASVL
jgi:predicted transglutaminase-like cysteine proteinase